MQKMIATAFLLALCGCTTLSKTYDSHGNSVLVAECGASTSMDVCYARADKECPDGYKNLSEDSGFNRKTLKFKCN